MLKIRQLAISILAISSIVVCFTACGTTDEETVHVYLNDYVSMQFSGVDGYGAADYTFDRDSFIEDYRDSIQFLDEDKQTSEETAAESLADSLIDRGVVSPDVDLSNGDVVEFSWDIDKVSLETTYNIELDCPNLFFALDELDTQIAKIVGFHCDRSGDELTLNDGSEIIFTAIVESNIELGDHDIALIIDTDKNEQYIHYMYDDGDNGDEKAGDGIYTCLLTNNFENVSNVSFTVSLKNDTYDKTIVLTFREPESEITEGSELEETNPDTNKQDGETDNTDDENQPSEEELMAIAERENRALEFAKEQFDTYIFSYDSLVTHMIDNGYSESEAQYAADNCEADWNEQALKCAKYYLESTIYSYSGLYNALVDYGFTENQALYGVDNCEADWDEQVASKARILLNTQPYSRSELIARIMQDGFTEAQAIYGASTVGY